MYLRRNHLVRTARAPAKLNLYLEVFGRRDDGFHDLETFMVPIRLADSLTMMRTEPAADGEPGPIDLKLRACPPLRFHAPAHTIPTSRENLIMRALELLRERSKSRFGASIELVKRIPAAAGLGGGSSDAAAALRLANRLWEINWPAPRLAELAAEIGSDVPFFLSAGAAVCRGRGERIERIAGMRPLHFVIVKPPADLSTADVYRAHDALSEAAQSQNSGQLNRTQTTAVDPRANPASWVHNRLQLAAASLSLWVERLRAAFDSLDFAAHQLSGSGSAYFGVCRHAQHARRLASILAARQLGLVYATRSCA
jgi:4-diphosphocytidyl-2-C-methyl-D-erythritol kinase